MDVKTSLNGNSRSAPLLPSAAKAAVDCAALTARLKPRPFKTKSKPETKERPRQSQRSGLPRLGEIEDGRDARPLPPRLFFVHEVAAAVLLPAAFVRLGAERLFLAVSDCFDAVAGDSSLDELILHRIGAIGAQSEVVFGRAALVAVPLDGDVNVGMLLQEPRIALQRCLIGCAHIVLVVIEVNVLHVLREEFLLAGGRSRCRRRWRRVDGDASGGVLGSAGAFRDQVVSGRVSRSPLARAAP